MISMISLLLALLMAFTPAADAAGAMNVWAFLEDWGVLSPEETAVLSADWTATEAGRELVRRATLTLGEVSPRAEWLSRATFVSRTLRDEAHLTLLLDGEESASVALGAADGLYVLDGSFLQQPVSLALPDLADLPGLLITAAQDNGWIGRREAMEMGMALAGMPDALAGMSTDPLQAEALDTSAWDAAVAAIAARREYGALEGAFALPESADCDAAARCWYLEVTPEDVRDLIVAALHVVRDNTFIGDAVDRLMEAASPAAYTGRRVTFNDGLIDMLLANLESVDTLIPVRVCLTGYEDAAGGLVRLEIQVLDAEAPGEAPALLACYQRRTTPTGVTHEVLFGDDRLEAFVEYTVMAPHGTQDLEYTHDWLLYAGSIDESGARRIDYAAYFGCVVNDTITGLTSVSLMLSLLGRGAGETMYTQTDYALGVEVHEAGFSGHEGEGAMIIARVVQRVGSTELMNAHYSCSFERSGVDLTGTEAFTLFRDGEMALTYEAELFTQPPEGSVFQREALRLVDLSREQLAAWVADVTAKARTWWDGSGAAVLMEDADLPLSDVDGAEHGLQVVYLPLGSTLGYEYEWELIEGVDVLQIDEEFIQPAPDENGLIRPGDSTQMALRLTGLQEGTATLRLTWRCIIPGQENEAGETEVRLTVDAEGAVWLQYE